MCIHRDKRRSANFRANESAEVEGCLSAASFLGRWFSRQPDAATLLALEQRRAQVATGQPQSISQLTSAYSSLINRVEKLSAAQKAQASAAIAAKLREQALPVRILVMIILVPLMMVTVPFKAFRVVKDVFRP